MKKCSRVLLKGTDDGGLDEKGAVDLVKRRKVHSMNGCLRGKRKGIVWIDWSVGGI